MKGHILLYLILSGFAVYISGQSAGHPVISEIRYDERTGINEEFVELYNPTPDIIQLENWSLAYQTKTGSSWRVKIQFGPEHQLSAYGYFLWGGDAVSPQPDISESVRSSLGFSNSGGHIALMDPEGVIIDLVAWEGGIQPEGEGDAGTTDDGGSLERKASLSSTTETMKPGGKDELYGNSYDSDRNNMDFVVHGPRDVVPQNTSSSPEPPGGRSPSSGHVSISPTFAYAGQNADFHIIVTTDADTVIPCIRVLLPWDDLKKTGKITAYSNWHTQIPIELSDDTLIITFPLSPRDSLTIDWMSVHVPDQATDVTVSVMTGYNKLPVTGSPEINILDAPIPIAILHENDEEGIPRMMDDRVSIRGVVTMGNKLHSDLQTDFFVQDSSGGIRIFARQALQLYQPGDVLLLSGAVHQYRGMTELIPDWQYARIQTETAHMPEPVILTCEQVNHTYDMEYYEANEGRLVRIEEAMVDPEHSLLTDSTGACCLFVDAEAGFKIPYGRIGLTGILIQHKPGLTDPGPPYRSDYYVRPRTENDIVTLSNLRFEKQPEIKEWIQDGLNLSYATSLPCSCSLSYGLTEADAFRLSSPRSTDHKIKIEGLQPATIYHYRISCSDGLEEVEHSGCFVTRSSSDGGISVFFNGDVQENDVTQSEIGQQDLHERFIECVETAGHSIDLCFMKLTDAKVREALLKVFERGIKIRFICEEDEAGSEDIQMLKQAGIPMLTDCSGVNQGKGIMHHKFAVFDYRDRTSLVDDRVWTGSFNIADAGLFPRPYENVVLIEDAALAAVYTAGFEIMWGGNGDNPDPERAEFESGAFRQIPHRVMTRKSLIEVFFSPEGDAGTAIENALHSVDHSLDFCMYSFTRSTLANAVIDLAHIQDINIRGLIDSRQIESDGMYSQWDRLSAASAQVMKYPGSPLLHHKYAIMDALNPTSDPVVITGSYNWTSSAEIRNNENVILIHSPEIASKYRQEFEARYHEQSMNTDSRLPLRWLLNPNSPNPFNGKTSVSFELPEPARVVLTVFDIRGCTVRKLFNELCAPGHYQVEWDGKNDYGRPVSNGVYIITLASPEYADRIKTIILK